MTENRTGSGALELAVGILLLAFGGWLLINTVTTDGASPISGIVAIVSGGFGAWSFSIGQKKRRAWSQEK